MDKQEAAMKDGWIKVQSKTGLADYTYVSSGRMNYGEGEHVQRLPDGYTVEPAVCMTQGEYDAAITKTYAEGVGKLERRLAEAWQHVEMGEKVMCACDDPQCYHCIEAVADSLIVYEDVSDERARTITVELPEGWALCRRTASTGEQATGTTLGEAAQKVASGLAMSIIKRNLAEGKSISIPSLDIVIEGDSQDVSQSTEEASDGTSTFHCPAVD